MKPDKNARPEVNLRRILGSPTYLRAYEDIALLHRVNLRPVRLQLESMKPEIVLDEEDVRSTLVFFGGSRVLPDAVAQDRLEKAERRAAAAPDDEAAEFDLTVARNRRALSRYYEEARTLAQIVSRHGQAEGHLELVITTGGGPGVMEAGNRGAFEVGAKSIGLNITLPHEQAPNAYITPGLCFQFHYFAIRKMHFLLRAKAAVFFPGGFGTMDELFETLCLIQTGKMARIPIVLVGTDFWTRFCDWEYLASVGTIAPEDLDLITICDTADEAWTAIRDTLV